MAAREWGAHQRPAAQAAGSGVNAPGDADLRVLIAEDNLVNQKVLLKVLQRIMPRGIAFVANNGLEALQVRSSWKPSLGMYEDVAAMASAEPYRCLPGQTAALGVCRGARVSMPCLV